MLEPEASLPEDWASGVTALVAEAPRRILVIGPSDAGKSTFCRLLLGALQRAGRKAVLIDADVGQKLTGPPATVSLGRLRPGGTLACRGFCFAGATNPLSAWAPLMGCLERLLPGAAAGCCVVNTSGLLAGPGQRLKRAKIEIVEPDRLVAVGEGAPLQALIAQHPAIPLLRLQSAPTRSKRNRAKRSAARKLAFRRYFAEAKAWRLPAGHAAADPAGDGAMPPRSLVALTDAHGRDRALGIVSECDEAGSVLSLLAPIAPQPGWRLKRGRLCLDEDFSESRLERGGCAPPGPLPSA